MLISNQYASFKTKSLNSSFRTHSERRGQEVGRAAAGISGHKGGEERVGGGQAAAVPALREERF